MTRRGPERTTQSVANRGRAPYNRRGTPAEAVFLKGFERDLTLKDGAKVHVRPIRPDDAPRLIELYDGLSRDTAYHRFFTVMGRLRPDWARFLADVDYVRRFALVMERVVPTARS